MEKVAKDFEVARLSKFFQRNGVEGLGGGGKVRVDEDAIQIADDEEWRIFEGLAVFQKLIVGGFEGFVFPLVFKSEKAAFPDICPTVATAVFGGSALKGKCVARGVERRRSRVIH